MIANAQLTDPGPASFFESIILGFLPAGVYVMIAYPLATLLMNKHSR